MRKSVLVFLLCLLGGLTGMDRQAQAQSEKFVIKFGYPAASDEEFLVTLDEVAAPFIETTRIPRKLRASGFRWGFSVTHLEGDLFSGHVVLTLPAPPADVSGDLILQNPTSPGNKTPKKRMIETSSRMFRGNWTSLFWFDPGDPLGEWVMAIYLNGAPVRTVAFTVITPE